MAVLSCAGAYVSGAAGGNACPAGSARIETEAACRTAAAAAGKTPHPSTFVETLSTYPRGCYYTGSNCAYLNTHAVGAGNSNAQLLCAAVTTGAYTHICTRTVPALVPRGARQRRRTADGRARARRVRVLKGYSNEGTQQGYSKGVLAAAAKVLRVLAAVFVG